MLVILDQIVNSSLMSFTFQNILDDRTEEPGEDYFILFYILCLLLYYC